MQSEDIVPEDRLPAGQRSGAGEDPDGEFLIPELPELRPVDPGEASEAGESVAEFSRSSRRSRRRASRTRDQRSRPVLLRRTDHVLRWGVTALLVLAPLAWGSVEAWSGMTVVIGSVTLSGLWLAREAAHPAAAAVREAESHAGSWFAGLAWPLAALLLLGVVQVLPLGVIVGLVSPAAAELWRLAGVPAARTRLSLAPEATLLSLAHLAAMILLFFAVLNTLRSRQEVRRLALTMVVVGFGFALFGIIRYFAGGSVAYWEGSTRVGSFGPYVNRNHFAALLGMIVPLGVGYGISLEQRRRIEVASGEVKACGTGETREVRPRQVLVGFMVAVMAGALFLSLSRGGIISTLFALSFLGLLLGSRRQTRKRAWTAATVVSFALAFAVWLGAGPLLARFESFQTVLHDPAGDIRMKVWNDALRMAVDFPLFGSGIGTFGEVFPRYQTAYATLDFVHAHNDWLQLLAETGLAGGAAVCALLARYTGRLRRLLGTRRDGEAIVLGLGGLAGLCAFLLHGFTEFNLHIPANTLWFTVLAALTLKAVSSKI